MVLITACNKTNKTEYQLLVEREFAEGIRNDSLFLGYYFGMSREEFYDHSWMLNGQKKIRQGIGMSVVQQIDHLNYSAKRNFYPEFYQEKIYIMPVKYSYNGWSPWNKNLWSDDLIIELVALYEEIYQADFEKMKHPVLNKAAYVAIQGNREIAIFREDAQYVTAIFSDLSVIQQKNRKDD
jgi:hypothetical protein